MERIKLNEFLENQENVYPKNLRNKTTDFQNQDRQLNLKTTEYFKTIKKFNNGYLGSIFDSRKYENIQDRFLESFHNSTDTTVADLTFYAYRDVFKTDLSDFLNNNPYISDKKELALSLNYSNLTGLEVLHLRDFKTNKLTDFGKSFIGVKPKYNVKSNLTLTLNGFKEGDQNIKNSLYQISKQSFKTYGFYDLNENFYFSFFQLGGEKDRYNRKGIINARYYTVKLADLFDLDFSSYDQILKPLTYSNVHKNLKLLNKNLSLIFEREQLAGIPAPAHPHPHPGVPVRTRPDGAPYIG